jgi:hypothetical protein
MAGLFVFESLTGLLPWLLPFSISMQFMILLHTVVGLAWVIPFTVSQFQHFSIGWHKPDRFLKWLGVVTCTVIIPLGLIHATPLARKFITWWQQRPSPNVPLPVRRELYWVPVGLLLVTALAVMAYAPVNYLEFPLPANYVFAYGDNPFAPSLAVTESGLPVAPVALNNSKSCGAARCHVQIYDEWAIGSHRWSASDQLFQAVEGIMLKEEGAHATRYCAGCHDPVSLLTGYKDADRGLAAPGADEGASCLVCHSIDKVDIQGNANYVWRAPQRYIYENKEGAVPVFLSEFLIRAFPEQHLQDFDLTLMRKPELCGACHKQFIDKEVNQFGWVQLQNQYDEWKSSHWNKEGDPAATLTCQRCHMALVDSTDPARGDADDPVRTAGDNKHRNHRILAANQFMPLALKLEGAEEHVKLVEEWLRGETEVPEIAEVWAKGPAVPVSIVAPETARPGQRLRVRVNITNNKVGHSFPTGPLDLIESWVEFEAKDSNGRVIYHSGRLDKDLHVEPGSFIFRAEGIDQYGKLIDRHNLWDMIGARYKRAIFPGYTDTVEYEFRVPRNTRGELTLFAKLRYRKVNQNFIDQVIGKGAFTTPITDMSDDTRMVSLGTGKASKPAGD